MLEGLVQWGEGELLQSIRNVAIASLSLTACGSQDGLKMEWQDVSPHVDAFIVLEDVRLNYLDWGGDGPPLVLLAGSWASPHAFDDLGARLSEDFRVVALARRGHGQSDVPRSSKACGDRTDRPHPTLMVP